MSRRLAAVLLLALLLAALITVHVEQDRHGVWYVTSPGIEAIVLRDVHQGPVVWVYRRGEFLGRWAWGRAERPAPPPTATPYPTSTPYPIPVRTLPLQGA